MNISETLLIRPTRDGNFFRSVLLLTFGLFLLGAPAPDAASIAEMTANFIVLRG